MHSLVGYFPFPDTKLCVQIFQTGRLLSLQAAQEVPPHILHSRFHLALGLRTVWPAQPWLESPVARKVQEHRVPDNLTSLVGPSPHRLHAVVQDLFWHP